MLVFILTGDPYYVLSLIDNLIRLRSIEVGELKVTWLMSTDLQAA